MATRTLKNGVETAHDTSRTSEDEEANDRISDLHLLWKDHGKGSRGCDSEEPPWFIIVNPEEPVGSQEMQDKVRNLCEGTLKAPLMLKRTRIKAGALISLRKKWRQEARQWYDTLNHEHRQEMRRIESLIINRQGGNFQPMSVQEQKKLFDLSIKYEVLRSNELDEAKTKTLRNTIKAIMKLEASRGRSS